MPVNALSRKGPHDRDPKNKETSHVDKASSVSNQAPKDPDEPTEVDLANKEIEHLWEQTEVIDMDTW